MDLGFQGQGRRHHRRERRHRAGGGGGLAAEGAHIVMAARGEERLKKEARRIGERIWREDAGRRLRRRDGRRLRRARRRDAKKFKGADILINNAGTGSNETIMEAPDEKWQAYWDLHVMAAVRLARGLVPVDEEARRRRHPPQRFDLRGAAALVRADLQRHQVGADDVLQDARERGGEGQHPRQLHQSRPGPDARLDQDREAADRRQRRRLGGLSRNGVAESMAPIKRFASPEEVAHFFVFLCSDKASYCVGSTYFVDGGMLKTVM